MPEPRDSKSRRSRQKSLTLSNLGEKVSFIWSVADLLRGPYRPKQYKDVMLPLRRKGALMLAKHEVKSREYGVGSFKQYPCCRIRARKPNVGSGVPNGYCLPVSRRAGDGSPRFDVGHLKRGVLPRPHQGPVYLQAGEVAAT